MSLHTKFLLSLRLNPIGGGREGASVRLTQFVLSYLF
jgi:hypothetical protein